MAILVDNLISDVRKQTENDNFSSSQNIGIADEEIVRYLNAGVDRLHARIISQYPHVFTNSVIINIVANQYIYAIPEDCYLDNKIWTVEYSYTGQEIHYVPLNQTIYRNLRQLPGYPSNYIIDNKNILIFPIPTQGTLRIRYVRKPTRLDKRRIGSLLFTGTYPNYTSVQGIYINDVITDTNWLSRRGEVSVVDNRGNILLNNLKVDSATYSNTLITLDLNSSNGINTSIDQSVPSNVQNCTISIASPAVITASDVSSLFNGGLIRFSVTGGVMPNGISIDTPYYISSLGVDGATCFRLVTSPGATEITTTTPTSSVGTITMYPDTYYVVAGKYTSSHPIDLNENIERYLVEYASIRLKKRDSSGDVATYDAELKELETEIIATYADINADIVRIPEINPDWDWGWRTIY